MFMLFDDMITGMLSNRKPNSTITELEGEN